MAIPVTGTRKCQPSHCKFPALPWLGLLTLHPRPQNVGAVHGLRGYVYSTICLCMYIYIYTHTHIHVCVYTYIYIYICVCAWLYYLYVLYIYIYICIQVYMYIHRSIYIHIILNKINKMQTFNFRFAMARGRIQGACLFKYVPVFKKSRS